MYSKLTPVSTQALVRTNECLSCLTMIVNFVLSLSLFETDRFPAFAGLAGTSSRRTTAQLAIASPNGQISWRFLQKDIWSQ